MENSKEIFDRVAKLARLGPYEAHQHDQLAKDFGRILELFKVLAEAPSVSNLPDLRQAAILRSDTFQDSGAAKELIENFPKKESSYLKVPKVIE